MRTGSLLLCLCATVGSRVPVSAISADLTAIRAPLLKDAHRLHLESDYVHPQISKHSDAGAPVETELAESMELPVKRSQVHAVQHVAILNKWGLWWLMALIIICIGVMCIQMDTSLNNGESEEQSSPHRDFTASTLCRLLFCVVALNITMLLWGVAQEFVMTNVYEDSMGRGEILVNSLVLVLFNRVASMLFCGSLLLFQGSPVVFVGQYESAFPAVSNLCSSWCQYQSLAYVSFPMLTIVKSAKLLPTLVLSSLRGRRHSLLDYAEAFLICSALVVFGCETEGDGILAWRNPIGIILLVFLMLADCTTPHLQDKLFERHQNLTIVQATFAMSTFASFICLVVLLCSGNLGSSLGFFARHSDAALHALVLSLCSTIVQFLITYTIKCFGPVVFTLIATTRQLLSVCISAALFKHTISDLAWLAAFIAFGTITIRALTPAPSRSGGDSSEPLSPGLPRSNVPAVDRIRSRDTAVLVCTVAICVPLGIYSVSQEFMATHTFDGEEFRYPMFLIAMNRTAASTLAVCVLKFQGNPLFSRALLLTAAPAAANLAATFCQYRALYFIWYPVQTLLKSLKLIPVMIAAKVLKNRSYSWLDYAEAAVITVLICFFSWNFYKDQVGDMHELNENVPLMLAPGVLLMIGYIMADSMTSNVQDAIFQNERVDPAQMLLGMQFISGVIAWLSLSLEGQLSSAFAFMVNHPTAILPASVLMVAEACGAYACMITVKLFGPAVFTLLLMVHQILSILLSVYLFNHDVGILNCLCLAMVSLLILTSSVRRVTFPGVVEKSLEQPFETNGQAPGLPRKS